MRRIALSVAFAITVGIASSQAAHAIILATIPCAGCTHPDNAAPFVGFLGALITYGVCSARSKAKCSGSPATPCA